MSAVDAFLLYITVAYIISHQISSTNDFDRWWPVAVAAYRVTPNTVLFDVISSSNDVGRIPCRHISVAVPPSYQLLPNASLLFT